MHSQFSDAVYAEILFGFSSMIGDDKLNKLTNDNLLKLIAAAPYLAGCDQPYRYAVLNVSTFLIMSREETREAFYHNKFDNRKYSNRLKYECNGL